MYAVALVNRALPYEHHLTFGADAPAGAAGEWEESLPNVPDGQIFVEFVESLPTRTAPTGGIAWAPLSLYQEYDERQGRWEKKGARASSVEMARGTFDFRPDHQAVSVLVHELVHALGLHGHVEAPAFEDSNMYNSWFRLDGSLPAVDAAALLALYTRLGEGTQPEDLSVLDLGDWSRETIHLSGELGNFSFGVRHSNGVSMPWTSGDEPQGALQDNGSLSGTVTWNGGLLGFTPDLRVAGGNASISVNLLTMNGRADFTELQTWAADTVPGAFGATRN